MPPFSSSFSRAIGRCVIGAGSAAALAACLTGEDLSIGRDIEGGSSLAPSPLVDGDAPPSDESLRVEIKTPTGTVSICAGDCVELIAEASGGEPPYMYAWDDDAGVGAGPNPVCPTTSTVYSVTVDSNASDIMAIGSLTINVVPCDDGSTASSSDATTMTEPASSPDASITTQAQSLCISNPTFEVSQTTSPTGTGGTMPSTTPAGWQTCGAGLPTVDPSVSPLTSENGRSFVALPVGSGMFSSLTASIGTTLCEPLQAGAEYSFCVNLGAGAGTGTTLASPPPPALQLWGGTSACNEAELLWKSLPITNESSWVNQCTTIFPTQTLTNVVLAPTEGTTVTGIATWSYVFVDDIVPGP